jgi:hypothetical protein
MVSELIPASVLEFAPGASRMIKAAALAYGLEQLMVAGLSVAMFLNVPVTTYAAFHPLLSWFVLAAVVAVSAPFLRRQLAAAPAPASDAVQAP